MLKKVITYTDYEGNERTESHYFNLSKAELMEMELSVNGGFGKLMEKISTEKDGKELIKHFKEIIQKSYGVKSPDGKRFQKKAELFEAFSETEAYSELFMELATNATSAEEFVKGIMPKDSVA